MSASASPILDKATVQARARAALIAPDGLVPIGGPRAPKEDDDQNWAFDSYCGRGVSVNRGGVSASSRRVWSGTGLYLTQIVHANGAVAGTAVLDQLRANAGACTEYKAVCAVNCSPIAILGPVDLGTPKGTDAAWGLCERRESTDGSDYIYCQAYLARGTVVSYVAALSGTTLASSTAALKRAVPIAAAALARP